MVRRQPADGSAPGAHVAAHRRQRVRVRPARAQLPRQARGASDPQPELPARGRADPQRGRAARAHPVDGAAAMKTRGFTLVEVLVAMMIMAILAVMAWQ